MFKNQVTVAIEGAYGLAPLNALSAAIWKSYASGSLSETDAQTFAEQIEARKILAKTPRGAAAGRQRVGSIFPARKPQRAPRRPESLARRRLLAASGPMPPALAARFTQSELAVLKIVADEHRKWGLCDLSLDEIAARAGCSRTSAQNAMREARGLGLLTIQIRKRRGQPNDTNVVRVISPEWLSWIARAPKGDRVQKSEPHGYTDSTDKRKKAKLTPYSATPFALERAGLGRTRRF